MLSLRFLALFRVQGLQGVRVSRLVVWVQGFGFWRCSAFGVSLLSRNRPYTNTRACVSRRLHRYRNVLQEFKEWRRMLLAQAVEAISLYTPAKNDVLNCNEF